MALLAAKASDFTRNFRELAEGALHSEAAMIILGQLRFGGPACPLAK
jgi:hypothetical protein